MMGKQLICWSRGGVVIGVLVDANDILGMEQYPYVERGRLDIGRDFREDLKSGCCVLNDCIPIFQLQSIDFSFLTLACYAFREYVCTGLLASNVQMFVCHSN